MGRYWWSVWIKVAILAVILLIAYNSASKFIQKTIEPYKLDASAETVMTEEASEETEADEETEKNEDGEPSASDKLKAIVEKVEAKVGSFMDYENFIFDYANDFAQKMMEESAEERNIISDHLS